LISDPYFGAFDECRQLSHFIPGFGFDAVFGCLNDDLSMQNAVSLQDEEGRTFAVVGNMHKETYRNISGRVLYRYEDGAPAVIMGQYGKGHAVISGVNLGLSYSSRALIADDILSDDKANTSAFAKKLVLTLCESTGIRKNPCNVPDVKVSVIQTEEKGKQDLVILINSAAKKKSGRIALGRTYFSAETVYGVSEVSVDDDGLLFSLGADESAVIKLCK
jgi:hypothetical protein